uniref:V-SNARE coiled-coil homology domain-containing protein n=1 Tax=Aureoumbra lagunensis TaxID=44058 RepID=A0A7S3K240_9STRA|mmetsp:Transcript_2019/g.2666  ORF Transcript_2019/g.2666 Transcript_2019/m.2666 type:complete len:240 (-) Transcript_2019:530-1249(-)
MAEPLVNNEIKVSFAAVARSSNDRLLMAWCEGVGSTVEIDGVRSALSIEQLPEILVGKHYNFSVGNSTWHVVGDNRGMLYLVITSYSYPIRHASTMISEIANVVSSRNIDRARSSMREGTLNAELQPALASILARYADLSHIDALHATAAKVESVKVVMQDSIEVALQNCVSLEAIDAKADQLQSQAGMFKTRAKKLRSQMWWKKCKMQLLVTLLIIIILACVIIPIVVMQQQAKKSKD